MASVSVDRHPASPFPFSRSIRRDHCQHHSFLALLSLAPRTVPFCIREEGDDVRLRRSIMELLVELPTQS
ncbi:hypothetical protein FIBSPDRAFT_855794 [Athelia psychrophila]|uniref:Uncharacterized protein n=1 Tax=Athelia psychrophila TaxID=1759441 RepID=A0A166P145_9AGAM|nr:hypothetical protein FIBSPDRAFT_855794 [Fibularhizoctonia sp. CBS 109695]